MFGKNDRRLFVSHHSYYNRLPSGISSNIADLVSQTFAPPKSNGKRNNNRQDAIVIGDDVPSLPGNNNSLMSGMLKLLGFDSSKIGAAAINGIIFIAQMVRYGASRFMTLMMTKTWDWYKIVDFIGEKVMNETDDSGIVGITSENLPNNFQQFSDVPPVLEGIVNKGLYRNKVTKSFLNHHKVIPKHKTIT